MPGPARLDTARLGPALKSQTMSPEQLRCLEMAERAIGLSEPNPRVGCVIRTAQGQEVMGHTHAAGGLHAEAHALQQAHEQGLDLRGATVWVSLEPCSHQGRTPPCSRALVQAGVARVEVACLDPNPLVRGRGVEELRQAGIEVQLDQGPWMARARALNIGFMSRMERGRPWVRMKVAASLDGTTALHNGRSQWITSSAAREDGHRWRARAAAILTGIGTVRDDDPRLDVRAVAVAQQPLRVVVDSRLDIDPRARVLQPPGPCLVYSVSTDAHRLEALQALPGVEVCAVPAARSAASGGDAAAKNDLAALMEDLGRRGHKAGSYNQRLMPISPIPELVAELAAGRMVILVDEEDRENEGDLVLAADHVTPQAINFMAKHGRGLICLTLTRERCERLQLPPMAARNGTKHSTAFTVSIEAATGVSTGISAADRARTIEAAVAPNAQPSDLVQPGHVFPLQAQDGGVLMRAGHTEAGCDLASMAGLSPASVICEIMNDDGTMARLPDLEVFAREHGLKIGTIADLIQHRSHNESLIQRVGQRELETAQGRFHCSVFRDRTGGTHLALACGQWTAQDEVWVRVHEPLSLMDLLDTGPTRHSWPLPVALAALQQQGRGVAVLLNAGEDAAAVIGRALPGESAKAAAAAAGSAMDLRTYGVGAQILRALGVQRMRLMSNPRRMPSMTGYGLEVTGFMPCPGRERDSATNRSL
ncbi:MAG: bifunctional diaminohydroxyphosphoribosylaminopyrimidine deaminase/5-amino-6-(5-phosphoribosylamino)uracil reductase RibD [Betaproteobacteria bacterium]|nr:bifunctional diaminohydroxyphosphoribosylaminopyrimidine deaminase/5-amino-6-(5-phosphoribosylamino)uracil reductase RibD [Betaproteobacteria bacterium]